MDRPGSVPTEVLASTRLFQDLPIDALQCMGAVAQRRIYRRHEAIFRSGDASDRLYVVERGLVKLGLELHGGKRVLDILGPMDCFGELALLDAGPRPWLAQTLDTVTAVFVPREAVVQLMRAHPCLMERFLVLLSRRVQVLTDLLGDVSVLSVPARLAGKLLDLAARFGRPEDGGVELDIPLVQDDLAAMIGATRTSVNRWLTWYENQGALQRHGRRIALLDQEFLHAQAHPAISSS